MIDGQTIAIQGGPTVGLLQISAAGPCNAKNARKALRKLLPKGTEVTLKTDPKVANRYGGHAQRYVFRGNQNVNLALVKKGMASAWFRNGARGRFAGKLKQAANKARKQDKGAWGNCEASSSYTKRWRTVALPKVPAYTPGNCHPSYAGACLDPYASDYDCAGGSGNGPKYTGRVRVVGPDVFGLDADGDGIGCE